MSKSDPGTGILMGKEINPRGCSCPNDCGESCDREILDFDLLGLEMRVEPTIGYGPRGYYPMKLRERLSNGRYTVYHKLGHGGYSTVWLAYDEKEKRHVSIKIMAAVDEELRKHTRGEIETLQYIKNLPDDHPGKSLMLPLLDSFVHEGPTGSHECYVSVPHKFSIETTKEEFGRPDSYFSLDVARAIVAQLIIAVSFLHENGIVHGDLKLSNFLLAPCDFSSLSPDEVCDKIGWPDKWKVSPDDVVVPPGCPSVLVPSPDMGVDSASQKVKLCDAKITTADFGLSWKPEEEPRYSVNTPLLFRAPEAMFSEQEKQPLSFASDVWSLGLVIYCVYARGSVIEAVDIEDSILADMTSLLGKPPQRWWDMWEEKDLYFEEDGEWISSEFRRHAPRYIMLEERVRDWLWEQREGNITGEEMEDLQDLLRQTLKWEPEERASATELINTGWMKKWGAPALESMYLARGEDRNVLAELDSITGKKKEEARGWPMILRNPFSTSELGLGNWLKRLFRGLGVVTGVRWWMRLKDVFGKLF